MQIHEVLQLFFMRFHILKLLHNNFIINLISYISFKLLRSKWVFFFFFGSLRSTNFYFCCWAYIFLSFHILVQIGLLLGFCVCSVFKKAKILLKWSSYSILYLLGLKKKVRVRCSNFYFRGSKQKIF